MENATHRELVEFVAREARLLDERRYEEWYALFADDGRYWIPASHDQEDRHLQHSLMDEDRLMLRLRIDRLGHARAYSQQPSSRSLHVLQASEVEPTNADSGLYVVRTPFVYFEARGEFQHVFGAIAWHTLARGGDGHLRIRLKRINLVNCEAALSSVQLFL